jgi:hypothetical protein
MKQNENDQNHKKESTPVVDDKPNGKSQFMSYIANITKARVAAGGFMLNKAVFSKLSSGAIDIILGPGSRDITDRSFR